MEYKFRGPWMCTYKETKKQYSNTKSIISFLENEWVHYKCVIVVQLPCWCPKQLASLSTPTNQSITHLCTIAWVTWFIKSVTWAQLFFSNSNWFWNCSGRQKLFLPADFEFVFWLNLEDFAAQKNNNARKRDNRKYRVWLRERKKPDAARHIIFFFVKLSRMERVKESLLFSLL